VGAGVVFFGDSVLVSVFFTSVLPPWTFVVVVVVVVVVLEVAVVFPLFSTTILEDLSVAVVVCFPVLASLSVLSFPSLTSFPAFPAPTY